MVGDLTLFQAHKQVFLKKFKNIFLPVFLSEHAYVVWLSRGSSNFHASLKLRELRYCLPVAVVMLLLPVVMLTKFKYNIAFSN